MSQDLATYTLLNTRSLEQASELSKELESRGANVIELPSLSFVDISNSDEIKNELSDATPEDWLIFTSTNGVKYFSKNHSELAKNIKVAAIGKRTALVVKKYGLNLRFTAQTANSEAFAHEFSKYLLTSNSSDVLEKTKIILLRAKNANKSLPKLLKVTDAIVKDIKIYDSELPELNSKEIEEIISQIKESKLDMLVFASSQSTKNTCKILGKETLQKIPAAAIGPETAKTIKELGLNLALVAKETSIASLVESIVEHFKCKTS